jgi:hypothetical protein
VKTLSEWHAYLDERRQALFGAAVTEVLEHVKAHNPGDEMFGLASWALGPRPIDGCDEFVEVEAIAPGKVAMRWYLPRTVFGSHWREILMVGTRPDHEIVEGDWLDFVLPQIAFRARAVFSDPRAAIAHRLETEVAWTLEEYDKMYLA